jgi:FAD/FMN-containing dehydrogenase
MRNKSRSRSSAILGFILVLSVLVNKCCTAESSHSFAVCHTLSLALPSQVSYAGNATYTASLQSYFSDQEADLSPACIVTPKTSQDVATLIKILASLNLAANNVYQFAIRSGGHTPWAGSANINSGVTVDLSSINEVVVNLDRTITSIGPGARWEKVYLQLDTMNLTVAGGRAAQVGVGGYLVGG